MTIWKPELQPTADPVYLAIARAIETDITGGRLKAGDRLPTHRQLARSLGVSIGTVTRAYATAARRGIIHAETGRGTFVLAEQVPKATPCLDLTVQPGLIDLSVNYPIHAEDPDLARALATLTDHPDFPEMLRYQAPKTDLRGRRAGAAWMRDIGLDTDEEDVILTAGAQHALNVILSAFTKPGDRMLTDQLTHTGAISASQVRGLRAEGVAMDEVGMLPDALDAACRRRKAQILYLMPTIHNPLSSVLTGERREALASVARRHDLLIVEDDIHRPMVIDAPPPVARYAPERTFFIASIAKVIAGGLRIAFVAAPPFARDALRLGVGINMMLVPPLNVAVAAQWLEDGTAADVIERKSSEARARQALAEETLEGFDVRGHPHGYIVWLNLPREWTSAEFALELRRRGVGVTSGAAFALPGDPPPNGVRICLGAAADRHELWAALRIVARMLRGGRTSSPTIV